MTLALHHVVEGDGPTVVLLGSLGATLSMWEPQLPALDGFRVLRVDLPGHGGSPVPEAPFTLKELADRVRELVGDDSASYVGLSFGGVVGMCIAADAEVDRLVLACTKPAFPPRGQWRERAELVRREGMQAVTDAILARWFANGVPPEFRAMLLACPPEGYARCCEALGETDLSADLGRIVAPTLVIAGAQDPTVTPDDARGLPGRLVVLERAAHLANVDDPDGFNAALVEHLTA